MFDEEGYRKLFVEESRENHENLVKNLLILEKGTDQNAIDELFRSCHTLKGALGAEGACVQLVDHSTGKGRGLPAIIGPRKERVIEHPGKTVDPVGLPRGPGIGKGV